MKTEKSIDVDENILLDDLDIDLYIEDNMDIDFNYPLLLNQKSNKDQN